MNALDILTYGHQDLVRDLGAIDDWTTPGVTTQWSAHDLVGHLASFERSLEEAMLEVLGRGPTPTLDAQRADHGRFNEIQVGQRRGRALDVVRAEYERAHAGVMALAAELGPERLWQTGTIPWYGPGYSLDDLIVYSNYAHKREHCAQLRAFMLRRAAARAVNAR
jgi:mycothiol maleylpyruvate isomerase-like protein